jgi:hypothetical protein
VTSDIRNETQDAEFRSHEAGTEKSEGDADRVQEVFLEQQNLEDYSKRAFNMFKGTKRKVTIQFSNDLLDTMVERFGPNDEDTVYTEGNDNTFTVSTYIEVSDQFFSCVIMLLPIFEGSFKNFNKHVYTTIRLCATNKRIQALFLNCIRCIQTSISLWAVNSNNAVKQRWSGTFFAY